MTTERPIRDLLGEAYRRWMMGKNVGVPWAEMPEGRAKEEWRRLGMTAFKHAADDLKKRKRGERQ